MNARMRSGREAPSSTAATPSVSACRATASETTSATLRDSAIGGSNGGAFYSCAKATS